MNAHAQDWIDAYFDDELTLSERRQAERHLAGCAACRRLLEERQQLASLLQAAPPPAALTPERRFIAEIALQMERRPARPVRRSSPAWLVIPVMLLLGWGFIETFLLADTLVSVIPGAEPLLLNLIGRPEAPLSLFSGIGQVLPWLGTFDIFDWNQWTALIGLLVLGLMYAGWFAAWWSHHRASPDWIGKEEHS